LFKIVNFMLIGDIFGYMKVKTAVKNRGDEAGQESSGRLAERDTVETGQTQTRSTARPGERHIAPGEYDTCPECGGNVAEEGAQNYNEHVCQDCGLVVSTSDIDPGPDWRSFNDGGPSRSRASRVSSTRHDRGLGSTIGASGVSLSRPQSRQQKLNGQLSTVERMQADSFTDIRVVASQLGLPKAVVSRACDIFRKAHERDIFGCGNRQEIWVGAVVYGACRDLDIPVILADLIEHLFIEPEDTSADCGIKTLIIRRYRRLATKLQISTLPIDPEYYVPLAVERTCEDEDVKRAARHLARAITEYTVGKSPRIIAGACVLLVAEELCESPPTQAKMADAVSCCPSSLRTHVTKIPEHSEAVTGDSVILDSYSDDTAADDSLTKASADANPPTEVVVSVENAAGEQTNVTFQGRCESVEI
jgi:transcription initiation factor TFIIB